MNKKNLYSAPNGQRLKSAHASSQGMTDTNQGFKTQMMNETSSRMVTQVKESSSPRVISDPEKFVSEQSPSHNTLPKNMVIGRNKFISPKSSQGDKSPTAIDEGIERTFGSCVSRTIDAEPMGPMSATMQKKFIKKSSGDGESKAPDATSEMIITQGKYSKQILEDSNMNVMLDNSRTDQVNSHTDQRFQVYVIGMEKQGQALALVKRPSAQLNIKTKQSPSKVESVQEEEYSPEIEREPSIIKGSQLSYYKPVKVETKCLSAFSFQPTKEMDMPQQKILNKRRQVNEAYNNRLKSKDKLSSHASNPLRDSTNAKVGGLKSMQTFDKVESLLALEKNSELKDIEQVDQKRSSHQISAQFIPNPNILDTSAILVNQIIAEDELRVQNQADSKQSRYKERKESAPPKLSGIKDEHIKTHDELNEKSEPALHIASNEFNMVVLTPQMLPENSGTTLVKPITVPGSPPESLTRRKDKRLKTTINSNTSNTPQQEFFMVSQDRRKQRETTSPPVKQKNLDLKSVRIPKKKPGETSAVSNALNINQPNFSDSTSPLINEQPLGLVNHGSTVHRRKIDPGTSVTNEEEDDDDDEQNFVLATGAQRPVLDGKQPIFFMTNNEQVVIIDPMRMDLDEHRRHPMRKVSVEIASGMDDADNSLKHQLRTSGEVMKKFSSAIDVASPTFTKKQKDRLRIASSKEMQSKLQEFEITGNQFDIKRTSTSKHHIDIDPKFNQIKTQTTEEEKTLSPKSHKIEKVFKQPKIADVNKQARFPMKQKAAKSRSTLAYSAITRKQSNYILRQKIISAGPSRKPKNQVNKKFKRVQTTKDQPLTMPGSPLAATLEISGLAMCKEHMKLFEALSQPNSDLQSEEEEAEKNDQVQDQEETANSNKNEKSDVIAKSGLRGRSTELLERNQDLDGDCTRMGNYGQSRFRMTASSAAERQFSGTIFAHGRFSQQRGANTGTRAMRVARENKLREELDKNIFRIPTPSENKIGQNIKITNDEKYMTRSAVLKPGTSSFIDDKFHMSRPVTGLDLTNDRRRATPEMSESAPIRKSQKSTTQNIVSANSSIGAGAPEEQEEEQNDDGIHQQVQRQLAFKKNRKNSFNKHQKVLRSQYFRQASNNNINTSMSCEMEPSMLVLPMKINEIPASPKKTRGRKKEEIIKISTRPKTSSLPREYRKISPKGNQIRVNSGDPLRSIRQICRNSNSAGSQKSKSSQYIYMQAQQVQQFIVYGQNPQAKYSGNRGALKGRNSNIPLLQSQSLRAYQEMKQRMKEKPQIINPFSTFQKTDEPQIATDQSNFQSLIHAVPDAKHQLTQFSSLNNHVSNQVGSSPMSQRMVSTLDDNRNFNSHTKDGGSPKFGSKPNMRFVDRTQTVQGVNQDQRSRGTVGDYTPEKSPGADLYQKNQENSDESPIMKARGYSTMIQNPIQQSPRKPTPKKTVRNKDLSQVISKEKILKNSFNQNSYRLQNMQSTNKHSVDNINDPTNSVEDVEIKQSFGGTGIIQKRLRHILPADEVPPRPIMARKSTNQIKSPQTLSKSQTKSQVIDATPGFGVRHQNSKGNFSKGTPQQAQMKLTMNEKSQSNNQYSDAELNHLSSGNINPSEMRKKSRSVLKVATLGENKDEKVQKESKEALQKIDSPVSSIQSQFVVYSSMQPKHQEEKEAQTNTQPDVSMLENADTLPKKEMSHQQTLKKKVSTSSKISLTIKTKRSAQTGVAIDKPVISMQAEISEQNENDNSQFLSPNTSAMMEAGNTIDQQLETILNANSKVVLSQNNYFQDMMSVTQDTQAALDQKTRMIIEQSADLELPGDFFEKVKKMRNESRQSRIQGKAYRSTTTGQGYIKLTDYERQMRDMQDELMQDIMAHRKQLRHEKKVERRELNHTGKLSALTGIMKHGGILSSKTPKILGNSRAAYEAQLLAQNAFKQSQRPNSTQTAVDTKVSRNRANIKSDITAATQGGAGKFFDQRRLSAASGGSKTRLFSMTNNSERGKIMRSSDQRTQGRNTGHTMMKPMEVLNKEGLVNTHNFFKTPFSSNAAILNDAKDSAGTLVRKTNSRKVSGRIGSAQFQQ